MGRDTEHENGRSPTDPDAPPTAEEVAAAEALRDALADPSRTNAEAELARVPLFAGVTLASPARRRSCTTAVVAACDRARGGATEAGRGIKSGRRARVAFAIAGGLAMVGPAGMPW